MMDYDYFIDNIFSARQWSAEMLEEPEEIKALIDSFDLVGRTIKTMRFIGLDYRHGREDIEDIAYNTRKNLEHYEEERQRQSDYDNIPDDVPFSRFAEIDEPIMIMFEDNDVFEIETTYAPSFSMSMNSIPWYIKHGINAPNIDAAILFSPCVGHVIKDVQVRTYKTKQHPMYFRPFDEEESERTLVSDVVLWMDNGIGIAISAWIDYCHVVCIDSNNSVLSMPFSELKTALFN